MTFMALPPEIREDILKTLDDNVLQVLASQHVLQLLAAPPFYLAGVERQVLRKKPLPSPPNYPLQDSHRWNEEQMVASRDLYLVFVSGGIIHKKVGVLESHCLLLSQRQQKSPPGVQLIELRAPVSILYADFVARENGAFFDENVPRNTRILTLHFGHEVTITLSGYQQKQHICSHRLQIRDVCLRQLAEIYWEEMRREANTSSCQTLLLAIMNRLHYQLAFSQAAADNNSVPSPENGQELSRTQQKHRLLCHNAIEYVQNNIGQQVSVKLIARYLGISEYHLSKVFHQEYGVTLIHHIGAMRIDIAKTMLRSTGEPVSIVAQRTGFSSAESFSHVFRKHTGMSPRQFRNQQKM